MKKGNPMLRCRLPADHWIWELDIEKRSHVVQEALGFYFNYKKDTKLIMEKLEKIESKVSALKQGGLLNTEVDDMPPEQKPSSRRKIDPKLVGTMKHWLE